MTSPEPPVVDLSCSRVADNQTGLSTLQLEFSYPNVSLINEAIYEYVIILRNMNMQAGQSRINITREALELSGVLVYAIVVGVFCKITSLFIS